MPETLPPTPTAIQSKARSSSLKKLGAHFGALFGSPYNRDHKTLRILGPHFCKLPCASARPARLFCEPFLKLGLPEEGVRNNLYEGLTSSPLVPTQTPKHARYWRKSRSPALCLKGKRTASMQTLDAHTLTKKNLRVCSGPWRSVTDVNLP